MSLLHFLAAMTYLCVTNAINKRKAELLKHYSDHLKMKLQEIKKLWCK